jgi:hypothetical protein
MPTNPKKKIKLKKKNNKLPSYTPGVYDADTQASNLSTEGYVVLPLLGLDYIRKHKRTIKSLDRMMESYPEFIPGKNRRYVLGGFGAFGNPSSFHHPYIRLFRQWSLSYLYPMFSSYELLNHHEHSEPLRNIEELPDRMLKRLVGDKPSDETWHRDTSPNANAGDDIFGGWINFDDRNQYFSAASETYIRANPSGKGFVKLTDDEHKYAASNKQLITIPPGHIIVFFQNALHEIHGKKQSYNMYRLFIGFRLTHSPTSLTKNIDKLIKEQAVLPLKSGQIPPMYAVNHEICWLVQKLVPWSDESFKPECKCMLTRKSGKLKGQSFEIVQRYIGSLKKLGLPLYSKYTPEDIMAIKPARRHNLLKPGNHKEMALFEMED